MQVSFTECSLVFLEKSFGLRQVTDQKQLSEWLEMSKTVEMNEIEKGSLSIFQKLLTTNVTSWNEQDLSLHFIGPIFGLIGFTEPYRFNLFAERKILAKLLTVENQEIELFGKPDEMIASGFREPELPYFCFQEFKREKDPNGDPIAQVLAAMLVGQALNQNCRPMYGCYVLGRDWYFMTLQDKHFCISQGFDATTEQVDTIFSMLKALKGIVVKIVE